MTEEVFMNDIFREPLHHDARPAQENSGPKVVPLVPVIEEPRLALRDEGWDDLPEIKLDKRHLARNRIIAAARRDPAHVAIDMLRTRLMSTIREKKWRTIGITSPRGGCGKTTLALNLAFSLAQQTNFKLALLDLDLHRPSLASRLGWYGQSDIESFLRGRANLSERLCRFKDQLAIATNSTQTSNAAELLMECVPGPAIRRMRDSLSLDLVVFDLPPMLATDDVLAILPSTDAIILVAAAGQTSMADIDLCEKELSLHSKFGGLVLNKTRYLPDRYGY